MAVHEIKSNKEYEFGTFGRIRILEYGAYDKDRGAGARLTFLCEPKADFGKGGDMITFVQLVRDDFTYTQGGKTVYAWSKSKKEDFYRRNYDDEGNPIDEGNRDCVLNFSVDQYVSATNRDFRYTEERIKDNDPFSNIDRKARKLFYAFIKENDTAGIEEYKLQKAADVYKNTNHNEDQTEKKICELLCSDEKGQVIPYVVFSGQKIGGSWKVGRMSDSPEIILPETADNLKGSHCFETVILRCSKEKYYVLGTVYWGWKKEDKDKNAEVIDIKCEEGVSEHFANAKKFWNALDDRMKIPDFEISHEE